MGLVARSSRIDREITFKSTPRDGVIDMITQNRVFCCFIPPLGFYPVMIHCV